MIGWITLLLFGHATPLIQEREPISELVTESVLRFPKGSTRLALRDFSGNGSRELLVVDEAGLSLHVLGADGRFEQDPALGSAADAAAYLKWPAGRVGWDLADFDGDGAVEIVLLLESGEARTHSLQASALGGGFDAGRVVMTGKAYLPPGVNRIRFVRDVDGDGRQDLVFPGSRAHRIYLARKEGWGTPIEVAYDLKASLQMGSRDSLQETLGQRLRVPWFRLEDMDGDGRDDLVAETEDRVAFHLDLNSLSSEPSWVLDLGELRAELPRRAGIDFDDLFSMLDQRVTWRIADLDGKAPHDLLILLGGKLRVYLGGSKTGPVGTPDQVLKSSGTVLWSFLRQVEGDAAVDLQLVRGERISMGRALRSLILPTSLEFDLYTYRNEAGLFSRKPTRRNSVTIELPRLLSLIDEADDVGEEMASQTTIRAIRLPQRPGFAEAGDGVADVLGETIVVTMNCAPEPLSLESLRAGELGARSNFDPEAWVESYFLEDFDRRGDGAERSVDLGELTDVDYSAGASLRRAAQGHQPLVQIPLSFQAGQLTDLLTADINADGSADLIALGDTGDEWVVQVLLLGDPGPDPEK